MLFDDTIEALEFYIKTVIDEVTENKKLNKNK